MKDKQKKSQTSSSRWTLRERYHATYWEWLPVNLIATIKFPINRADDILEILQGIGILLFWFFTLVTFPISIPIMTYILMKLERKRLPKSWGKEALEE